MAWWWVNQWFSGWILCLPFNGCRERWRCDAKGLMAAALLAVSTLNYFFQSHVIIIINYPVHLLLILFISFFLQNECIISGPPELDHEEFTPEILVKWMNTWMMSEYILLFNSYGASLLAQLVKNPPAMWETWVWSLGWEDPLEEGVATVSNILAWRIPWTLGVTKSRTWLSGFHFTSNSYASSLVPVFSGIDNPKNVSLSFLFFLTVSFFIFRVGFEFY